MITRVRPRTLAGAAAAATLAVAAAAAPGWAQDQVVLPVGHTDALDVHFGEACEPNDELCVDGELRLMVKDDTVPPPVVRDPADVIFQVLPEAAITVPDDQRYAFLGAAGTTVWVLPQVQHPDLLWPGWSTERLAAGVFAGNQVTLALVDVTGPGMLSVFTVDAFGNPVQRWHAAPGGAIDPSTLNVPINTHAHANWAFDAEGTYTLTFQADATLSAGGTVSSGPVDYTFVVGELDGDPGDPGDPDPDPPADASQVITATIDELGGALVISVDPDDRTVMLPAAELASAGDRLQTAGQLRPVTVTDTRPDAPGWSASGQVGTFEGDAGSFGGSFLGWTPAVSSQAPGQGVAPGAAVASGFDSGDGLSVSRTLASAKAGKGIGTAQLGAGLDLQLPTETPPGQYTAVLTLTAI